MTDQESTALEALRSTIAFAGKPVRIENKTVQGIVEDMTEDEVVAAGGASEAGGFRAIIPLADISKPKQQMEIETGGVTLEILTVTIRNGIAYEIQSGDSAGE